jgi:uncharacterized protein (TIGR03032 family)
LPNPKQPSENPNNLWQQHSYHWRDPMQIFSAWSDTAVDAELLRAATFGDWWNILEATHSTLIVTREYEHLALALRVDRGNPVVSYMVIPHPSGLAVDEERGVIYLASTRNPNQVFDLTPVNQVLDRLDVHIEPPKDRPLIPVRSRFLPGSLYLHDLALKGGELHANAVGQNAVVKLHDNGRYERVWWPQCIEVNGTPEFRQNHLQLNSIAAGETLESSFFSASTDKLSKRRPGHKNFPVDKRGVIFSGATREVTARGLTRPHSARLHQGKLWVDNSGYGEFGFVDNGQFTRIVRLPGWTRGLCFYGDIAFVGTSRVIPRFRQYAPGLAVEDSVCGVHAVDLKTGTVLGSIQWPQGNQIFALELVPVSMTGGFPFVVGSRNRRKDLFYGFDVG